jgi:hypothetical protein
MAMAPSSALGVVVMFYVLRYLFGSDKTALGLALLYAFGTPVFFRTGYLNQNLMLGHIAFMGFAAMWNPARSNRWSTRTRFFLGGLAGGTALLFDYSGAVLLLGLFLYGVVKRLRAASKADALRHGFAYALGALGPVCLLWFYQWKSFGHPFLPAQHWMPPTTLTGFGYRGYGFPQLELLAMLAFDYRFGLFVSCPLMLLALASPLVDRGVRRVLPRLELAFLVGLFAASWLLLSGNNYARLQFNTGIRHLSSVFPFLFLPAAAVLIRLPRLAIGVTAVLSVTQSWCLAMYRDVERGLGVLEPILRVFSAGFQLPALTTFSRMGQQYGDYFAQGVSPLPLFALTAAILYLVWSPQWSVWKRPAATAWETGNDS